MEWTDSIGDFDYGRKGGYIFWEAKGRAREIYNTTLYQATWDAIESVREQICGVRLTLCMVGKSKEKALPTIVISGGKKKSRELVLISIKEMPEIEANQFQTANLARFPPTGFWRARAKLGDILENRTGPEVYYYPDSRPIGLSILINAVGQNQQTKATGGGVIQCGAKFFYLTTAHAFQRDLLSLYELDPEEPEEDFEIHGEAMRIELDDPTDSGGRGSETPRDSESDKSSLYESNSSDGDKDFTFEMTTTLTQGVPELQPTPELLGRKVFDSTQGLKPGLDYALIEVSDPGFWASNAIEIARHADNPLCPTSLVSAGPRDVDVIIVTSSKKPLNGKISGTKSLIASVNGNDTQVHELWTVRVQEQLHDGDCGSWVLDANTGALFGHVVADNSSYGLAYVVPAVHVFEDLRHQFDAAFLLPVAAPKIPSKRSVSDISHLHDNPRQTLGPWLNPFLFPFTLPFVESPQLTFKDEAREKSPTVTNVGGNARGSGMHINKSGVNMPIYPNHYATSTRDMGIESQPKSSIERAMFHTNTFLGLTKNTLSGDVRHGSTFTGRQKMMVHFPPFTREYIAAMDDKAQAALKRAAAGGYTLVVRLLLELGADASTGHGQAALIVAAENGHDEVIHLLIRHGVDPSIADHTGQTALLCASKNGRFNTTLILLLYGADLWAADRHGRTPLIEAAYNGHTEVVRLLVDTGCDISGRDYRGRTPLMEGARNGHLGVVRELINAGGNVRMSDNAGQTPLMEAAKCGHEAVVRLLREKASHDLEEESDRKRVSRQ